MVRAGLFAWASLLAGCGQDEPIEPSSRRNVVSEPVAVSRPDSVFGELVIARPARFVERARVLGTTSFLPRSLGMLAALVLGIEPESAALLDGGAPIVGALMATQAGAGVVLGLRTTSAREMRARLSTGSQARYRAVERGSVVVLEPREGATVPPLALSDDYLLVARRMEDAVNAGAYLARTVAKRERPAHDAVLDLDGTRLGPALARTLEAEWQDIRRWLEDSARASRAAHAGQRADLADPETIIALLDRPSADLEQLVRDAERARVSVDLGEDVASLGVTVDAREDSQSAALLRALPGGDAPVAPEGTPLFMSAGAELGLGHRLTAAAAAALGDRLTSKEAAVVRSAGDLLDEAFQGPLALVRMETDGDGWAWALVGRASGAEPFADLVEHLRRASRLGPVQTWLTPGARATNRPAQKALRAPAVSVAGTIRDGFGMCVISSADAEALLERFPALLASRSEFVHARLQPLGSTLLLSGALRVAEAGPRGEAGWLVLAVGRQDSQAYARIDAELPVARSLLGSLAGP